MGLSITKEDMLLNITGISLSVLTMTTELWRQQAAGCEADKTSLTAPFYFAVTQYACYVPEYRNILSPHVRNVLNLKISYKT